MTLQKLTISMIEATSTKGTGKVSATSSGKFTCQFNPVDFTLSKENRWTRSSSTGADMSDLTFGGGKGVSMSINLFFDSTDTGDPVRNQYEPLRNMMLVSQTYKDSKSGAAQPPWVLVQWGTYIGFAAVIEKLDEKFTLFKPDGTPVRAEVTLKLEQVADEKRLPAQNPTTLTEPRRTWVVQEGERLDLIAAIEYDDSAAWRFIADVNGILDPMRLVSGQVLKLPPLE